MVNEAQIYDQSSSAVYRGPLITMHFRGEPQTELLSLLLCVPASSADPYKGIPCTYFNQWAEASPSNWSCTVLSLFASLLGAIMANQSGHVILTNPDSAIWTNQTLQI